MSESKFMYACTCGRKRKQWHKTENPKAYEIRCPDCGFHARGKTRQATIDEWNRRIRVCRGDE